MSKAAELAEFGGGISGGSNAVEGLAKAWINFNGTGTIAERDSFGVTSLTDKTTGQYDVNFSSGFTDANYSGVANGWRSGVGHAFVTHVPAATAAPFL